MPARVLISSPSAEARLRAAIDALSEGDRGRQGLLIAPTRAAADECAAAAALARGGLFGVGRTSVIELVMRLALPRLSRQGLTPTSAIGAEAVVARARFDAVQEGALNYFAPVAGTPGFPRAAARTLDELQMAGVAPSRLASLDLAGADLATLLEGLTRESTKAGTVSRAGLWAAAAAALVEDQALDAETALVLLDVPITSVAEERFVAALLARKGRVTITVPAADRRTLAALARLGIDVTTPPAGPAAHRAARGGRRAAAPLALARLQQHLFAIDNPPAGAIDESVSLFSAPGEGRETVEVARRVLAEADRGVPFDEIAILLRAPHTYFGLLEHALARAGVPAWFERGTRRPDPAGRAFLALLACADEHLSARRFAEYLSLGQVPVAAIRAQPIGA